jgi:hypothetical protein
VDSGPETFHDHEMCFSIRMYTCTWPFKKQEGTLGRIPVIRLMMVLWVHGHCIVWLYWNCNELCVIWQAFFLSSVFFTLLIIHWLKTCFGRRFCIGLQVKWDTSCDGSIGMN